MNKIFTIFVLLLFSLTVFSRLNLVEVAAAEPEDSSEQIASKKLDKKAQILQKYLAQHDSPMQYHAQDFIDAANKYDLDWKMLPAIAGVESTFGKFIPGGYNAYGWGVYGTQAILFSSWTDGIYTVAKGLRENYLDKGLTDPYSINRVYAQSKTWGGKVTFFMNDLDKFASDVEVDNSDVAENLGDHQIAAISASLATRSGPVLR